MFPFCRDCAVRKCASAKAIQNCDECEELDACEKTQKLLAMFSADGIRKMIKLVHEKATAASNGGCRGQGLISWKRGHRHRCRALWSTEATAGISGTPRQ